MLTHVTELEQVVQAGEHAPRTKTQYLGRVRAFIEFAGSRPADWTTLAVERWRNSLLASGLQPATVSSYLIAIRYASKRHSYTYDTKDFARIVENPRGISGSPDLDGKSDALTPHECRLILRSCSAAPGPMGLRDRALFLTGLHAAFRREELATMEIQYVREGMISVVVKGRRWHHVPVGGEALEALERWIKWLDAGGVTEGRVFRSLRPSVANDWRIGDSLSPRSVYRILRQHAEAAGVSEFHTHRLRHTFVTMAREADWPDWKIRQITGHGAVGGGDRHPMTDRYTHNNDALGAKFPELSE